MFPSIELATSTAIMTTSQDNGYTQITTYIQQQVDPQNQLQIEEVTIEEGQQFINQEIPHVAQITTKSESRRNVSLF